MICYLVTRNNANTMEEYLSHWGGELASRIKVIHYESLPRRRSLPVATYIFSDLERLTSDELAMAAGVWDQLAGAGRGMRLLNDPRRALRRYDLLRTLAERGINDFRAYRVGDHHAARLPAFVRYEHQHQGSLTPLLHTREALDEAIAHAVAKGMAREHLLVVEFRDTGDERGIYRKYGAFKVGDRVLPRHVFFLDDWVVKVPKNVTSEILAEERAYLETHPHEAWERGVFGVAGIDYGRLDYALADDRPQAWEINTNPGVVRSVSRYDPRLVPHLEWFVTRMQEALKAIDHPASNAWVPVSVTAPPDSGRRRGVRRLVRRVSRRIAGRRH